MTGAVPSPKSKVTVPVGVPAPGGTTDTRAVKVTSCPATDGSGEENRDRAAEAWPTIWLSVPVEGPKSMSPLYSAVTVYGLPEVLVQVWCTVATPAVTVAVTEGVPSPKSKVTVPVGVPAPGASAETVAVMSTGRPVTEGSGEEATAVVVAAWATVCTPVAVEGLKSASPL
ncbi:hypothetical protein BG653_05643 [Streptomyces platensis]|uniref:Uncharacterized protein n=1 Tax=Streptomyces platensis TaxID=58346 RepID=A0ABX3XRD7_STRPT|nr:hypothetical protein BG653_05643 [Streptomyces platensis]